jgi:hypothetical protein
MGETVYVQDAGRVLGFSEPLPPGIEARLGSGQLRRVDKDGSPWAEQAEPAARSEPAVPAAHVPAAQAAPRTTIQDVRLPE